MNKSEIVLYGEEDPSNGVVRYVTSIPKKYVKSIELFYGSKTDRC